MISAVKNKQSMYTLSNRQYKLIANTRRGGISQKVDPLDTNSNSRESVKCDMSLQRPVFHQVNGRRTQIQKVQENFPPQYEELIRYIHDTWTGISKEYEISRHSSDKVSVPKVKYYQDTNANTHLTDFEPFDLESFWGERFLQNIQQST